MKKPPTKPANNITANAPHTIFIPDVFTPKSPDICTTLLRHTKTTRFYDSKNRPKSPTKPVNNITSPFPAYVFPAFLIPRIFSAFYRLTVDPLTPPTCPAAIRIFPIVIPFCETWKNKVGEWFPKTAFAGHRGHNIPRTLLPTECAVFARMYINKKSQTCVWLFWFVCQIY